MENATPVRVAIVGAGWMGTLRASALRIIEGVEIVGVTDMDMERAAALSPSAEPAYEDVEQLMKNVEPDAVIVATSDRAHREPTVKALDGGAHVLVEKPMATTIEDCDAMVAASRGANRRTAPSGRGGGPQSGRAARCGAAQPG